MKDTSVYENYRDAVVGSIIDLAKVHDDIVVLDSDLSSCLGTTEFQKEFPDRFYNCGIAEANMAAVAGGLSSVGLTPFIHSFGCFASRRMYDQVFISIGYAHRTVHIVGTDPGITAQYNGGTHMPFEDIALMRQIPGLIIYEPSDIRSLYELVQQVYATGQSSYLRTPRKGSTRRYGDDVEIRLGKAITVRDGSDLTIIATGVHLVSEAEKAAAALEAKGVSTRVIDLHTIRPFDAETITKAAAETGRLLICENGRYPGGTGEMISALLFKEGISAKVDFINVGERFGEVGSLSYLAETFGMTADNMVKKAEALM